MADTARPKLGSPVHYVAHGVEGVLAEACRTATVTRIDSDGTLDLAVLHPTSLAFERHIVLDSTDRTPGTWHWCDCTNDDDTATPASADGPAHH